MARFGRRTGRRKFDVVVAVMNPRGHASAAGDPNVKAQVDFEAKGKLFAEQIALIRNALMSDRGRAYTVEIVKICRSSSLRTVALARRIGAFMCQSGDPDEISTARQFLEQFGLAPPVCAGTGRQLPGMPGEVMLEVTCYRSVKGIVVTGASDWTGTNCLVMPPATCAAGPACAPHPPNAVCFDHPQGFPTAVGIQINAQWGVGVEGGLGSRSHWSIKFDATNPLVSLVGHFIPR